MGGFAGLMIVTIRASCQYAGATGFSVTTGAGNSSSPLIDLGTSMSNVPNDYDGTSRPQGAGYDIGAFEYH